MVRHANRAWIIAADMGYGHQRAAFPLRNLGGGKIINANNYSGIPQKDKKIWHDSRRFYEFISRTKAIPLIGDKIFDLYDRLQSIPAYYPKRDLSKPTIQVKQIERWIKNKKWGKHLIDKLKKNPLPIVTSFFVPAFMADIFNYPGEIYCLCTDTDISRAWVASKPNNSKIKYFAPSYRVVERLRLYGVPAERIFLTGFPLPVENMGSPEKLEILQEDLKHRIKNLDPTGKYWKQYSGVFKQYIPCEKLPDKTNHPLTLMFAVGGAGAQRELGVEIMKSLKKKILAGKIRLILVAGIHNEVYQYFKKSASSLGLAKTLNKHVQIIHAPDKYKYFNKFNKALRTTDIIWTKPSELSFYVGLGIPLIMSEPIGSQEKFNRIWVDTVGAGMDQLNPEHTDEWLFDLLNSGWLAEAAVEGFVEAPKYGTFNIKNIVLKEPGPIKEVRNILQF